MEPEIMENLRRNIRLLMQGQVGKSQKQNEMQRAIKLYQKKKEIDQQFAGEEGMTKENLLQMIMGVKKPSSVFGEEAMQPFTPQMLGQRAGGGMVGTAPGATFSGGQIFGQKGQPMGEYAPGFEPTPSPEIANQAVVKMLMERSGIAPQEAFRKFAGFGEEKEKKVPTAELKIAEDILTWAKDTRERDLTPMDKQQIEWATKIWNEKISGKSGGIGRKQEFKKGETREINGVLYQRNAKGQWIPQ